MTPEEMEADQNEMWAKIAEAEQQEIAWNDSLLKSLSIEWSEIKELLWECHLNGKIEVVFKPEGDFQGDDDTASIKNVHIDQYSSYPCEDCYYGYIYGQLKNGSWIKIPYTC